MHSSPSSAAHLSLYTANPSLKTQFAVRRTIQFRTPARYFTHIACKATGTNSNPVRSSSSVTNFDLYDLFGVENDCSRAQIKLAYRALQKKCHPDIAGPVGHDMAIVLNEAYAVLSDPTSRLAYDKEHAKFSDFRGFTGKPIYSVWSGSESEKRAVFVDEVKCVGCLKCALFAEKTFAVESIYGRARVVAQWADPEDKIQAAIETCPVDCISIVERLDLAALEFLMSKKPRGKVRIGAGNLIGTRTSNVFDDLEKFQARYALNNASSKESDIYWEAKASAVHAIRLITNWLYWQTPPGGSPGQHFQNLTPSDKKSVDPSLEKIMDVAEARKQARETVQQFPTVSSNYLSEGEYWDPSKQVFVESNMMEPKSHEPSSAPPPTKKKEKLPNNDSQNSKQNNENDSFFWSVPLVFSVMAAIVVRTRLGEAPSGGLEEHIGGSRLRDIVNSNWLQVILAGVTWYLIGMAIMELVLTIQSRLQRSRE